MVINVSRYSDTQQVEIRLDLPQGESFIHGTRSFSSFHGEDRWDVSVLVPWYGDTFYTREDSTLIFENIRPDRMNEIFNAPTYDLIAIVREALPVIKEANRLADLEI